MIDILVSWRYGDLTENFPQHWTHWPCTDTNVCTIEGVTSPRSNIQYALIKCSKTASRFIIELLLEHTLHELQNSCIISEIQMVGMIHFEGVFLWI